MAYPNEKDLRLVEKKLRRALPTKLLPKSATRVETFKYEICKQFVIYLRESGKSQAELARKLKLNKSLVSKIVHFHFEEFTVDRLLRYLEMISPELKPALKKVANE